MPSLRQLLVPIRFFTTKNPSPYTLSIIHPSAILISNNIAQNCRHRFGLSSHEYGHRQAGLEHRVIVGQIVQCGQPSCLKSPHCFGLTSALKGIFQRRSLLIPFYNLLRAPLASLDGPFCSVGQDLIYRGMQRVDLARSNLTPLLGRRGASKCDVPYPAIAGRL